MGTRKSKIYGVGAYVPDRVITNHDLAQWMETSDEWIQERTGIKERRWVAEGGGVGSSDLAVEACKRALAAAEISLEQLNARGMIILATLSPDHDFPGTGVFLQRKLGLKPMPVLDIRQQCTGFIYGLSIADQYVKSGMVDYVLVVGAEVHSTGLDRSTRGRDVTVLFGDGAGAAVVGPAAEDDVSGILSSHLYADGTFAEDLWVEYPSSRNSPRQSIEAVEQGRHFPKMEGKKVFKQAVSRMPEVVAEALKTNGYTVGDLAMLVPHQANLRINEFVQKALGLPDDKIWNNIQRYGNTTAATIPLCLDEIAKAGRLKRGDLVCLVAFGAGFTWASALLRW